MQMTLPMVTVPVNRTVLHRLNTGEQNQELRLTVTTVMVPSVFVDLLVRYCLKGRDPWISSKSSKPA